MYMFNMKVYETQGVRHTRQMFKCWATPMALKHLLVYLYF